MYFKESYLPDYLESLICDPYGQKCWEEFRDKNLGLTIVFLVQGQHIH